MTVIKDWCHNELQSAVCANNDVLTQHKALLVLVTTNENWFHCQRFTPPRCYFQYAAPTSWLQCELDTNCIIWLWYDMHTITCCSALWLTMLSETKISAAMHTAWFLEPIWFTQPAPWLMKLPKIPPVTVQLLGIKLGLRQVTVGFKNTHRLLQHLQSGTCSINFGPRSPDNATWAERNAQDAPFLS